MSLPVLLSVPLRRNIDMSTRLIWNGTKQVQEEEADSSYTEALFQSELSRHIYWADNINQTQWTIVNKKTEKKKASVQIQNCSRLWSVPNFLKHIVVFFLLNLHNISFFSTLCHDFFLNIHFSAVLIIIICTKRPRRWLLRGRRRSQKSLCSSPVTWLVVSENYKVRLCSFSVLFSHFFCCLHAS